MRTLKKSLSLVLVLAMVFSFCAVGSSAAFDDADKITAKYAEAIEVMNALEILQGSDGSYDPQGSLTRAQAARIIVAMLQAEDLAKVAKCTFTDVAETDWFYDEIAYCQSIGLMKGYGDGTVGPNDELTGPAFALMVMKAAGVDVSSVNPATYALDTVTLANKLGLGEVAELTAEPFTREIAAGLAFAGLQHGEEVKETVTETVTVYEIVAVSADFATELADVVGERAASFALAQKLVADAVTAYNADEENEDITVAYGTDYSIKSVDVDVTTTYTYTEGSLAEDFDLVPVTYVDAYGVLTSVWTVDGDPITEPALVDALVGTYGDGAKFADIAKDLGITAKSEATYVAYVNGAVTTVAAAKDLVDSKAAVGANLTLSIYKDAWGDFTFSYTEETLVQASVAKTAETTGENKGLYAWTFGDATLYDTKDAYTNEAYYLVVFNADEDTNTKTPVLSIELAESDEGKVTSMDSKKTYAVVNGSKYTTVGTALAGVATKGEYTFYFNSNGFVIGAVAVEEEEEDTTETYAVVTGFYVLSEEVPGTAYTPATTVYNGYAQCVTMEGTEVSYLVDADVDSNWDESFDYDVKDIVVVGTPDKTTGEVELSKTTEDSTVLTIERTGTPAVSLDAKKTVKVVDGENYYYTNAKYIKIALDKDGKLDKLSIKEGTLAEAAVNEVYLVYVPVLNAKGEATDNNTVTTVVYFAVNAVEEPYAGGIIYAVNEDCDVVNVATDKDGKDIDVYTHTVYLDGVKTEITMTGEGADKLTKGAFYTYAIDEKTGYYTLTVIDEENEDIDAEVISNATVENVYGNYVTFADLENLDVSNITIVDLRAKGDGKLAKDVVVSCVVETVNAKEVITLIYIVG